jgi:hypothetical protein
MSGGRNDVDEVDRLARVKLSCTIEPGDLAVTGLVSELGGALGAPRPHRSETAWLSSPCWVARYARAARTH